MSFVGETQGSPGRAQLMGARGGMIIETIVGLAACGAVGEWLLSREDRAHLRQLRDELSGSEPPPLIFPVLFPSADAAARGERALRRFGFDYRADPDRDEIPGAGHWADVEARLPLTWPALRVARLKVQWAVLRERGTVFGVEWRDGSPNGELPDGELPDGDGPRGLAPGASSNGASPNGAHAA